MLIFTVCIFFFKEKGKGRFPSPLYCVKYYANLVYLQMRAEEDSHTEQLVSPWVHQFTEPSKHCIRLHWFPCKIQVLVLIKILQIIQVWLLLLLRDYLGRKSLASSFSFLYQIYFYVLVKLSSTKLLPLHIGGGGVEKFIGIGCRTPTMGIMNEAEAGEGICSNDIYSYVSPT